MVGAAAAHPDLVTGTGFVYRRQPAVAAIRDLVRSELGEVSHFNGRYWCDYARSAADPDGLALQGRPGHRRPRRHRQPPHRPRRVRLRADDLRSSGAAFTTKVKERCRAASARPTATPGPSSATSSEPVENDDVATFTAHFASGAVGTFSISRVAPGHANSLGLRPHGRARRREVGHGPARGVLGHPPAARRRPRRLQPGARRAGPPLRQGRRCRWTSPAVSFGVGDLFGYQAAGVPRAGRRHRGRPAAGRDLRRRRARPHHHRRRHPLGRGRRRRPSPSADHPPDSPTTHRHLRKEHPCTSAPTTPASATSRSARPSTSSPASASPVSRSTPAASCRRSTCRSTSCAPARTPARTTSASSARAA